jgi:tetratricopeptide (TPR) repeat protein
MDIRKLICRSTIKKFALVLIVAMLFPAAGIARRAKPLAGHEKEIIITVRDHILSGEYDVARKKLAKYERAHPSNPLGSLGLMLVCQAQMLDNLNFNQQREYQRAYERNKKLTKSYEKAYDDDPWHALLRGATYGVHGIFQTRSQEWMSAFTNGLKGMITFEKITRRHPEVIDARLGEGLLRFWRGAMAQKLSLPGVFADDKQKGLEVLSLVAEKSELVGPSAALAMTYALYHEKDYARALTTVSKFITLYPRNYVARLMKARCYYRLKQYALAENELKALQRDYPKNETVLYHLGYVAYLRKNLKQARTYLERFVKIKVEDKWLGFGNYRLGRVYDGLRKTDLAIAAYKKALKYKPEYKSAKARLKRALEKKKKDQQRAERIRKQSEKRRATIQELRERIRKAREHRKVKDKGQAYKKKSTPTAP